MSMQTKAVAIYVVTTSNGVLPCYVAAVATRSGPMSCTETHIHEHGPFQPSPLCPEQARASHKHALEPELNRFSLA